MLHMQLSSSCYLASLMQAVQTQTHTDRRTHRQAHTQTGVHWHRCTHAPGALMHHAPCTMHQAPLCTMHHAPCTIHHAPCTMHHAHMHSCTRRPYACAPLRQTHRHTRTHLCPQALAQANPNLQRGPTSLCGCWPRPILCGVGGGGGSGALGPRCRPRLAHGRLCGACAAPPWHTIRLRRQGPPAGLAPAGFDLHRPIRTRTMRACRLGGWTGQRPKKHTMWCPTQAHSQAHMCASVHAPFLLVGPPWQGSRGRPARPVCLSLYACPCMPVPVCPLCLYPLPGPCAPHE